MGATRVTITVPAELAETVQREADAAGMSVSGFAAEALRAKLVARDAARLAEFDRAQGYDSPEYAEVMALLALAPDMTGDAQA